MCWEEWGWATGAAASWGKFKRKKKKITPGLRRLFVKLNQSFAAPLLLQWAHPTWAGEAQGTGAGSAAERRGRPGRPGGRRAPPARDAEVGAGRTQAPARTPTRLGSPDLGAVLQAIRLHFVTDFWTLHRPSPLPEPPPGIRHLLGDRKSTRLNSSH